MPSPYFINVDPSAAKLRMFFGRRREIRTLVTCLMGGDSVLLVGERRIGKTFLLNVLRGLADPNAGSYGGLLDQRTATLLAEVRQLTASFRWTFIDMLSVNSGSGFYVNMLAEVGTEPVESLSALWPLDQTVFLRKLAILSEALGRGGQRAVVLVDESEKLVHLDQGAQVLSSLKSAMQRCPQVDFVLAGDLRSHQITPDFSNLIGAMRPLYLGPLDPDDALALIQGPVLGQISFDDPVLERILSLTGCKPGLLQILCDHLYNIVTPRAGGPVHIDPDSFTNLWESELRARVFECFEAPLRDCFEGLQGDEKAVFASLVHHPLATESQIAGALAIPIARARTALDRLNRMHRIVQAESGFRIAAGIEEEFGASFIVASGARSHLPETKTLNELLNGESETIEYKETLRWDLRQLRVNPDLEKAVAKTVAAFLNSGGGTLLIGVSDTGAVEGIQRDWDTLPRKNKDGFEQHLHHILASALGAEFSECQNVSFAEVDGKCVCIIRVSPSPRPVYLRGGAAPEFFVRVGNTSMPFNIETAHTYIGMHWSA